MFLRLRAAEVNSRLFNSTTPPDLLQFIQQTTRPDCVGDRVLAKARAQVYSLITTYLDMAGPSLLEYGPAIRDTCFAAAQREMDARASSASLGPLVQLLQQPWYDVTVLRVEEMFATAMKMIRVGKLGPRMKGVCECVSVFTYSRVCIHVYGAECCLRGLLVHGALFFDKYFVR